MACGEPISIAVVGIGCRLPGGANNPEALWSMLAEGRDAWSEIPEDRFTWKTFFHPSPEAQGFMNHRGGHFIQQDVRAFDADFFGISPLEARAIDPQQRLLLETSYEAAENAGIPLEEFKGTDTAVFAATFANDYERLLSKDPGDLTRYHLVGTGTATFANRISYTFDLKGPSVTVDTGCSGSLVALHQACQSLRNFESSMALAGGAVLILSPDQMIAMSQQQILNNEGRCYSFDSRGLGYGRGEGAAMVLLKRLDDAIRHGDQIRTIIRNTYVNQDGRTTGITLPSQDAQERLAQGAFRDLNFTPADIQYIEAHGTGTPAGDEAEIGAIKKIYAVHKSRDHPLLVGSMKPNIGHLESASGVAGLIKTILCMEKSCIPPNLLFLKGKESLHLDQSSIEIPTSQVPWPSSRPKRAVVNNFGYGGTNAMAILEEADLASLATSTPRQAIARKFISETRFPSQNLFLISAKSEVSLSRYLDAMMTWLRGSRPLNFAGLALTLSLRRSVFPWRRAVIANNLASLINGLEEKTRVLQKDRKSCVVFVFTGQGAQWPMMGLDLMVYPEFARSIRLSDDILRNLGASWSLERELQLSGEMSKIHDSRIGQPATTAVQVALVDLLKTWNITPKAVIGHSSGEISAAYTAGFLSRQGALEVAYHRGFLAEIAKEKIDVPGAMLAVGSSENEVRSRMGVLGISDRVTLACVNSPASITTSGDLSAILRLKAALETDGIFTRHLKVDAAYHSHHMESVACYYRSRLSSLTTAAKSLGVEFYSTVTAQKRTSSFGPEYWVSNLVSPVKFSNGLEAICQDFSNAEHLNFVEIGPHSALKGPIHQTLSASSVSLPSWLYIPTLIRNGDGVMSFLETIAALFETGVDAKFYPQHENSSLEAITSSIRDLPPYQWDHSKIFWHEPRLSWDYRFRPFSPHELLGTRTLTSPEDEPSWCVLLGRDSLPWLEDHQVDGFVIFPATAYLAMVMEAIRQWKRGSNFPDTTFKFRRVSLKRTLSLPELPNRVEMVLTLKLNDTLWSDFRIFSLSDGNWREHCQGQIKIFSTLGVMEDREQCQEESLVTRQQKLSLQHFTELCSEKIKPETLYETLRLLGNEYGSSFALIKKISVSQSAAIATVSIPDTATIMRANYSSPYIIHPTVLDAALQTAVLLFSRKQRIRAAMPIAIQGINVSPRNIHPAGVELIVTCELRDVFLNSATFDLVGFQADTSGELQPVFSCYGGELRATSERTSALQSNAEDTVFEMRWSIDPASITAEDLESLDREPELDIEQQERKLKRLLNAANFFNQQAAEQLRHLDRRPVDSYAGLFDLMARHAKSGSTENLLTNQQDVLHDLSNLGVEGELLARVGPSLSSILTGETDPLGLLLENQLLYRVYQDDCTRRCNTYLINYIQHLAFKNPALRILEIGAGTGGSTIPLFSALSPTGQAFATVYDFTDVSSGFFEQAKVGLKNWENLITMKSLDIEKDPRKQGFEEHSYDVVIAGNVLHATQTISVTLSNVHKLLKPGGVLALTELTRSSAMFDMTFALLPGWGSRNNDGRYDSPLLSVDKWDTRLRHSSFTGVELAAYDFPGPSRRVAFLISRTKIPSESNGYHVHHAKVLNHLHPDHLGHQLVASLRKQLTCVGCQTASESWSHDEFDSTATYIIIDSSSNPVLANCAEEPFQRIKVILTKGAKIVWINLADSNATQDPGGSLAAGFARTARSEYESIDLVTIDVQHDFNSCHQRITTQLALIISQDNSSSKLKIAEFEYRLVNGKLHIPRIVKNEKLDATISDTSLDRQNEATDFHSHSRPLKLKVGTPGLLNTLQFIDDDGPSSLGFDDVEIEVHACGINFKDLWIALGQMRSTDNMVGECAGIVRNVGENFIDRFSIGDRVCALTATPYSSKARANGHAVHKLPHSMSFITAASIPVAFCTAYYSLVRVARLQHGQRVLIHAGSGALGQAAIQIARSYDAEIFTTTGTVFKRQLLTSELGIPEDHVFSSRTTAFKNGILRMTHGQGVDVALNALSGEMLHSTWECIAEMGTFVEVGKMEIRRNAQLDMEPFDKNITFASVDMILLARRRPDIVQGILSIVLSMFDNGTLQPVLPVTATPISEIETVFRMMQARKHTGKLVLDTAPGKSVSAKVQPLRLKVDGTYVIVGGLGKLGRQICSHLSALGAGYIILLSRQIFPPQDQAEVEKELSNKKTHVRIISCDVSKLEDVRKLSCELSTDFPPLKGILQGPMILRDRSLSDMTVDDLQSSIAPKYQGTQNLVEVFRNTDLDFFVMLSSLSGIVGLPGQANYAAGNTYQDHVAHGDDFGCWKNVKSLDMAVLSDTHVIPKEQQMKLLRRGILSISNEVLFPYLDYAMDTRKTGGSTNQILIGLDMQAASEDNKSFYSRNPIFSQVFASNQHGRVSPSSTITKTPIEKLQLLCLESPEDRGNLIADAIREKVSLLVAMNYDNINIATPIVNFGLDSLIAIELKNWITKVLHAPMQTSDILDSPSIAALTKVIMQRMEPIVSQVKDTAGALRTLDLHPNLDENLANPDDLCTRAELPKLPLPSLEATLETFQNSVRSFATREELIATRAVINELLQPSSVGHKLQARLERLDRDAATQCWLKSIHDKTFWLERRAPLRPSMNFFSTHALTERQYGQAEKAALISLAAFEFKQKLDRGEISQDIVNEEPQCMESLDWVFNAYRRPGLGCDTTLRFPGNDYIVAMRNGNVYKIPLLEHEATISHAKFTAIFQTILQDARTDTCWASVLTADERNQWAKVRALAIDANPSNEEYFSVIEKALFVVCLDGGAPQTSEERVRHFLLDDNRNRWNDKTLSFIVCENGVSAFWCEHSMIDGTTLEQLAQAVNLAANDSLACPTKRDVDIMEGRDFARYTFVSNSAINAHIDSARQQYLESIKDVDFSTLQLPNFGERFLRRHKIPPKGALQCIISLAAKRHFGYNPASYEAVSMRSFHLGRLDIYQVHTPEMDTFVSATENPHPNPESMSALRKLLHEAAKSHAAGLAKTSRGRGWDRHISALRAVLKPGEEEPKFFRDPVYVKTRPRKVFVSFSRTGSPEWGSVWRDPEALYIGVEVFEDRWE
ncbi:putative polyketide synthase [Lindgomyces ingoldianus]|uniref:Polyketide synthase n=1 Tax=Lindgomyces ingoldianus TaxID=673940 RepID=A0ACB6RA55_9PLEO|nr:putative polyketide synthase [Lindgomyces ingoldianus]KAF2475207.1 putative polyketide synthase [Lindgomyces ingoldianus]